MIKKKSKYFPLTLFSGNKDIYSHKIRMILSIKNIYVKIKQISFNKIPKTITNFHNYEKNNRLFLHQIPMLIDRYIILYEPNIIINYINEKFPYPSLLPIFPLERSENRLIIYNITSNWYKLINIIERNYFNYAEKAKKQLSKEVSKIVYIFIKKSSFLINLKLTLLDCYIAPILWRIKKLKIILNCKYRYKLYVYMNNLFSKRKFINSLTKYEINMNF
ncbi:hypothetical protein [Candidatus Annandia pinicola]|uniref:hypothetical protein n=1 Tax=Candidatus Annandia pinicola TaxID=1345117 RepID=UPI001D01D719|nr:hypothetical protein [Candidatus Annandia pinicola]UDG80279.1 Stringent starvation protein A [Candidatus Annandia pinicola]